MFDGDERKYKSWATKIFSYLKLKVLTEVFGVGEISNDKFVELVQYLDKRSLSLVMQDTKDNAREALKIKHIRESHYPASGNPRIITLYNQPTNLKKSHCESITDYIIRAENAATAFNAA